jgi:hypothetical protein
MTSEPSEAAIEAATQARADGLSERVALAAAHDPALGLDRSVRLGDVVEWLREPKDIPYHLTASGPEFARRVARKFGGGT